MNHDLDARRCKRRTIERKLPIQLVPCRYPRSDGRWTKEIESELSLLNELIPGSQGKISICCGKTGDEMILPCLDVTLGLVSTMDAGRDKLNADLAVPTPILEDVGGLIVKTFELGLDTTLVEELDSLLVCVQNNSSLPTPKRLGMDVVDVLTEHDEYIVGTSS